MAFTECNDVLDAKVVNWISRIACNGKAVRPFATKNKTTSRCLLFYFLLPRTRLAQEKNLHKNCARTLPLAKFLHNSFASFFSDTRKNLHKNCNSCTLFVRFFSCASLVGACYFILFQIHEPLKTRWRWLTMCYKRRQVAFDIRGVCFF